MCGFPHNGMVLVWKSTQEGTGAMATPQADSTAARGRRLAFGAMLVAGLLALLGVSFDLARRDAVADLSRGLEVAARTQVQTLESLLAKQRAVATVLSDDSTVRQALVVPSDANLVRVSLKLSRLRDQTSSSVIYLLNDQGVAVAASNWDEAVSFVGSDYSFRDYFTQALLRGEATQFALGTVSNRPGLYLSHDVIADDAPVGVTVVKVEFDSIERNWAAARDQVYVTDDTGRIVLTADPALRFQPLPPVQARQPAAELPVPGAAWRLIMRAPAGDTVPQAAFVTGSVGFGLMLLFAGGFWLSRARRRAAAERRYRADLERAVAERTRDLSDEMRERQAAEQRLVRLQGEMVQANKLATLGQITAGVAHEVNTPLATIRLLADNGQQMLPAGAAPALSRNLDQIRRMTDRIGHITTELRGFARKATGTLVPISVKEALDAAVLLAASRRRAEDVRLILPDVPTDLRVIGETVRLEQILINLIQNAHEAVVGRPDPWVRVDLTLGQVVRLTVSDSGPGLTADAHRHLFTPFTTSKPQGLGLGLVISRDIARDFGGSLIADPPQPGQGAVFHLDLRVP